MLFKKKAAVQAETVDLDKEGGGGGRTLQGTQAIIVELLL